MIQNFKHKGLQRFWETGSIGGIHPNFAGKIRRELDALNEAETVSDLDVPGFGLHSLKGDRAGEWALTVSRNWRITFKFAEGNAYDVNYEDYH